MNKTAKSAFFCILAGLSFPGYADAQNVRTWISGSGVDQAGCGPITTPCRTLQYAHDNTASGGEIDIKDSAGYGTLTITKAVTVVAEGVLTSLAVPSGGTGITVNAGASDTVVIRGITIDGHAIARSGISFSAGQSLTVDNCHIRNVTDRGIDISVAGGKYFNISNSEISKANYGIFIQPFNTRPLGAITNVSLHDNSTGLFVGYNTPTVNRVVIVNNDIGIGTELGANVLLGQSVVASNTTYGVFMQGGNVTSYGDNYVNANGTDISGGSLTSLSKR